MGPFIVFAGAVALIAYGVALVIKKDHVDNVRPLTGPIGIVKTERQAG